MLVLLMNLFVFNVQETVKLIPVYERTFDDTIVDVIFDNRYDDKRGSCQNRLAKGDF